jgi:phenylacetate-coenzyme A ligase PaaK-like adenylate-forming protein
MHTDEMHVSLNTLAAIERPDPVPLGGEEVHPLLYTTLYESAGRLLINAESGDFARLEERDCGCVMQQLGLTLHIHHVRSYEKLTSEGLNYPVDDLTEIIESRLPAAFGGGPCDYQLIEEEAADGKSRLTLRVHPAVGPLNDTRVLERLAEELGRAGRAQSFMAGVWQNAGTLSIERKPPQASLRGKTLPVHFAIGRES